MKECKECLEFKGVNEFYIDRGRIRSICKICVRTKRNEKYKENPLIQIERSRRYRNLNKETLEERRKLKYDPDEKKYRLLFKNYGLTKEKYLQLLTEQDYKCAICKIDESELTRCLQIDHDHSCCPGKKSCGVCIRGLLCASCNGGLGLLKDSLDLLKLASDYLCKSRMVL